MRARLLTLRSAGAVATVALVGGLVGALTTGAAASAPRTEAARGTLNIGVVEGTGAVPTLDPTKQGNAVADTLAADEMVVGKPYGSANVHPWLARSVTHPNPTTYVYHLRSGVKFSDGRPLTSADVVTSWNYEAQGAYTSFVFSAANFKSATASGPNTVVVTLTKPSALWPSAPSKIQTFIFEKKQFEANQSTFGNAGTMLIGTGPYEFDSFAPTTGMELSRNRYYWGKKPPWEHISVKFFSTETSLALAMRAGQINVDLGVGNVKTFKATAGSSVRLLPGPTCAYGVLDLNTAKAQLRNVHVRRAIAYATSRPKLIKAMGNSARALYSLILPDELHGIASNAAVARLVKKLRRSYPYSLAKAKQELAKSPYPHGFHLTVPIEPGWSSWPLQTSTVANEELARMLRKIGIRLTLTAATTSEYFARLGPPLAKEYPAALEGNGCASLDPNENMFLLGKANEKIAGNNSSNWAPKSVDKLLATAAASSKPAVRFKAYSKILKLVNRDVPYIPLFTLPAYAAVSKKVAWPQYSYLFFDGSWGFDIKPA